MAKWVSHSHLRNTNWGILINDDGHYSADAVNRAIMLDIREELRALNRVLACPNFMGIPHKLEQIRRNTIKKRRAKKAK